MGTGITTWTVGPWEVRHKRTIFPQGETAIAIGNAEQHRPEAEANARLMAASPDLAAALAEIETICTEDGGATRRRMGTRVGNCIVVARAALAKARGETP